MLFSSEIHTFFLFLAIGHSPFNVYFYLNLVFNYLHSAQIGGISADGRRWLNGAEVLLLGQVLTNKQIVSTCDVIGKRSTGTIVRT